MDLEDRVVKLKKETIALRKEMVIMKTLVKQQNEILKNLLEKSQADELYKQSKFNSKLWFPIRTQEELDAFEKTIDQGNRMDIMRQLQHCLKYKGLSESLDKILDEKLVVEYNLEGHCNKRRLLNYENFLDVVYRVTQAEGWDHEKFLSEFRKGMKKIKMRHCKKNERMRRTMKKQKLSKESYKCEENDTSSDNTEDEDDDDDDDK